MYGVVNFGFLKLASVIASCLALLIIFPLSISFKRMSDPIWYPIAYSSFSIEVPIPNPNPNSGDIVLSRPSSFKIELLFGLNLDILPWIPSSNPCIKFPDFAL